MLYLIFILCTVSVVHGDLEFTKISKTYNGEPCINDCVNNKCISGRDLSEESCSSGCQPAPRYHTSQRRTRSELCLSRCGKFGFLYEWCFVSQDGDWDYCSSETRTSWVRDQTFTYDYGPCATDCTLYDNAFGPSYYLCDTYWDDRSIDRCDPKLVESYVESKTVEELDCIGLCQKQGTYYYWCYDTNRNWNYCAPPARPPSLSHFADKFFAYGLTCSDNSNQNIIPDDFSVITDCSFNGIGESNSVVSAVAKNIEELDSFRTVHLNNPTNPVYQYTVREPQSDEEPLQPLVIKAKFTSRNTNFDSCGTKGITNTLEKVMIPDNIADQLISCHIGEIADEYYFGQQHERARCSWLEYKKKISDWVEKSGRTADVTVVIIYKDESLIPIGFGVNLNLKYANGTVYEKQVDRIICNNGTGVQNLHVRNMTATLDPLGRC